MKIEFPKSLNLKSDISIHELTMDDLNIINKWHNSTELYTFLVGSCHYPSKETDQMWIQNGFTNASLFRGVIKKMSQPIGVVYLTRISFDTIVFEIFLGAECERGKGIGTIVCSSIIESVFSFKEYNKIVLTVLADNIRAVGLYKKCGFNIESESTTVKDNKEVIIYNMSILRSNYENKCH